MKIDKYEKLKNGKYRVYLNNGEVIDTYDDIILSNELLLKKDIDMDTYNRIYNDSNLYKYYSDCIKYINVRVRSINEINNYLKRKNLNREDIDKIVSKLIENKFLNDDYFCSCFIKDKLRFTSWGPYRIIQELKGHMIDGSIIDKNISNIEYDFVYDKLEKLIDKKIKANRKLDKYKLRDKLYNSFFKMGYESDMIVSILNDKL